MRIDKKERRNFLKFMAGSGLYLSAGMSYLNAGENNDFDDYKAIVVLFQMGGNDSLNMFIPSSDDPKKGYSNYYNIRNNIRVADTDLILPLSNGKLDLSQGNPYAKNRSLLEAYTKGFYRHNGLDVATNGIMPELADLVNRGKVAIVANCGNLIEPATKAEFANKTKTPPPFLYSHDNQRKFMMNGEAGILNYTGWAGRLYDRWKDINGGDIYGMNISVGRVSHLFEGNSTSPLILNPNGPTKYYQINRTMYDNYMDTPRQENFRQLYNKLRKHSFNMQDTIVNDWNNNSSIFDGLTNHYGGELFSVPSAEEIDQVHAKAVINKGILLQLKAVAKLAKIGKDRGLKRQIFFINDGGYDNHHTQTDSHSRKLRPLSLALGDFYTALEAMGMDNDVTLLNASDFARSTGNNGDGSDHAWGGSYFVLGGAVKGGLYGTMPDLTLGSDDDMTKKGRLIPTTSMSQYYATVVKWFGMDENELKLLFPELSNFQQQDLGFMK